MELLKGIIPDLKIQFESWGFAEHTIRVMLPKINERFLSQNNRDFYEAKVDKNCKLGMEFFGKVAWKQNYKRGFWLIRGVVLAAGIVVSL